MATALPGPCPRRLPALDSRNVHLPRSLRTDLTPDGDGRPGPDGTVQEPAPACLPRRNAPRRGPARGQRDGRRSGSTSGPRSACRTRDAGAPAPGRHARTPNTPAGEAPPRVPALGRQLVGDAGRPLRVRPGHQQRFPFEPLEAFGQDVRRDTGELVEQIVEPARPGEQRLHYQQGPPVTDPGQRLGQR